MITAKDGKYTVTFRFANNCTFGLIGFLKPEYYSTLNDDNLYDEGYAEKNMLEGFDLSTSGLSSAITSKISEDFNEHYYDIDYTESDDGSWYLKYTTDDLSEDIYLSGLGKNNSLLSSYVYMTLIIDLDESKIQETADLGNENIQGEFSYNSGDLINAFKGCLTSDKVTLSSQNGKIYATYKYDDTEYLAESTRYVATRLLDENQNPIEVTEDGTFTLEYSSYEDLIFGKNIYIELTRTTGKIQLPNPFALIPNITSENIVLTDETTGVKVKTNSLVINKNSTLNVKEVTDDPEISGSADTYEFIKETLGNAYENINIYSLTIQEGDEEITETSRPVEIYLPIKDVIDKENLRLLFSSNSDYGWLDSYASIVTEDGIDYYVIKTSSTWKLDSAYALYDLKSTDTDGENLSSGTYSVPIALFNATKPEEMSMSNKCLGDTAKLIVDENGKKTIILCFNLVDLLDMNGYMIQMWYEDSNGEEKEVTYTGYFKNADGTYYTDDINEGTTDYYPTGAYFELPTDSSQFNVKFRVSAMDAILGGSGDASRNAIFTVYYQNADKISDEIEEIPQEEIIGREQADKTELNKLLDKAKEYSEDDYTPSTYTTLVNAVANAQSVADSDRASQEEVDKATESLQTAIDGLTKRPAQSAELDINNLEDGKYQLYAQMLKTDRENFSMSNNAINHTVQLDVVNGEYYITVQFKGLAIYNQFGYLKSLGYYDSGYTYNSYGIPQGTVIPADVVSTYDIVDKYNNSENLYPQLVKFKLVDKASEKYVPLQVFVPIMEAIAEGTGTQDVLMQLDWTTLEKTDEDITLEDPEEQSPEFDYTDSITGIKIHADKGVFPEGTSAKVTQITSGESYTDTQTALEDVSDKFNLYNIGFVGEDGGTAEPNGKIKISIPIPSDYTNPQIYRIKDGKKTLVSGTAEDGYFTFTAMEGGNYAIVEKSASDNSSTPNADNSSSNSSDTSNNSSSAGTTTASTSSASASTAGTTTASASTTGTSTANTANPATGKAGAFSALAAVSLALITVSKKKKN